MPTIDLGTNLFKDCGSAVCLRGKDIFTLRQSGSDEQLLCDFDVTAPDGKTLAVIRKNQVVHAADGVTFRVEFRKVTVLDAGGNELASAAAVAPDTVKVTGTFWHDGLPVVITPDQMRVGRMVLTGNRTVGGAGGIKID